MRKSIHLPRHWSAAKVERLARGRSIGFLMRMTAFVLLAMTIWHGAVRGGHLANEDSPWPKLSGQLSSLVGMAADDIRITGLNHQSSNMVLAAVGVKPGGSLIGFDAAAARATLEGLDWVASANVQLLFPNQLEIEVAERVPFAVWQKGGNYYVIDKTGAAMSSLNPSQLPALPLVTGPGAEKAAEALVNQLEATPDLMLKLYAAARVGQRRWNLYFDHGVTALLPDKDEGEALARLQELEQRHGLLSKGVKTVDLRFSDRVIIGVADGAELALDAQTGSAVKAN
jgi:cell division protein FtsQ